MSDTQALRHSHVKRLDGVVVLKPHGDLTGGPETDEIETLVDRFDGEGVTCLVVNLAAVSIMNSLALSRLIRAHLKFSKRGASVLLCNLDTRIEQVFVIAKLSFVFPVFQDETAAVTAGRSGAR